MFVLLRLADNCVVNSDANAFYTQWSRDFYFPTSPLPKPMDDGNYRPNAILVNGRFGYILDKRLEAEHWS